MIGACCERQHGAGAVAQRHASPFRRRGAGGAFPPFAGVL